MKKGDRVRVKSFIPINTKGVVTFVKPMRVFCGKRLTVEKVNKNGFVEVKECTWVWDPNWFISDLEFFLGEILNDENHKPK